MSEVIINLFLLVLFNSLFILGVHRSFYYDNIDGRPIGGDQMIFWKAHYYGRRIVGEYLSKPLFNCITCMASVWSIPVYYPFMIHEHGLTMNVFYIHLLYIPVLSILTTILYNKLNLDDI